ncbi:MAG: hypothetical protein V2I36_11780 [Desulfopila sp.]|jgi:predicted glycosyltransferase|nr:hypothetical protein [Desulfopila sp.]
MGTLPRLDILLYAHDGRGIGHAGRTIAIGIALRRLAPRLRVLFVSGCRLTRELIGSAPLDWVKLPSYETIVQNGTSRGIQGKSNFSDHDLGVLRAEQIHALVSTVQPRLVLADHSPQGKHRELLPALQRTKTSQTQWILGVRGIVGQVDKLCSTVALSIFAAYYSDLLWYGDSRVLGTGPLLELGQRFSTKPLECGYVSRLKAQGISNQPTHRKNSGVTVSIPWIGEKTPAFLQHLYTVLNKVEDRWGQWILYLDQTHQDSNRFSERFESLPWCHVEEPGERYRESLLGSDYAVIYGGYNSIMDVLSVSVPALVILRDMRDGEQQEHLERLLHTASGTLIPVPEDCSQNELQDALEKLTVQKNRFSATINLDGADNAAKFLIDRLKTAS